MANNKVSFEGIGQVTATFYASGDIKANTAVKITDSATVAPGADGDEMFGVALTDAKDGFVTVQVYGIAALPCADATVKSDWLALVCDGKGGMRRSTNGGPETLVVANDGNGTIYFRL